VASLTRAAAYEFRNRGLKLIPDDQLGTFHMICKRALGSPALTEGKHNDFSAFIEQQGAPSRFRISGKEGQKGMDRGGGNTEGDDLLQRITVLRNQHPGIFKDGSQLPKGVWLSNSQQAFRELWEAWKDEAQLMDFTDLLEECLVHVAKAPGDPAEMFGDEAQDWSKLEVLLFRDHWGQHAERVNLIGDPDQAIYEWRGADPRIFLDHPVPPERKILLSQSYRVPREVRNHALRWITREIEDRAQVEYESRPEAGSVGQVQAHFKFPEQLRALIETIHKDAGSCMIMASCDYMLRPTLAALKSWGIPYSNPYRSGDKAWNPLRWGMPAARGKKPETTKLDKLLAYLMPSVELRGKQNREWTWEDIEKWTEPLRSVGDDAVMVHGAKTMIKTLISDKTETGPYRMETFLALFRGEHGSRAHAMDLDWWFASMREKETAKYAYYQQVIKHFGQRALVEKPRMWVGTIHSFKGGEADTVILFPDLSPAADREYQGPYPDPTARLFYVAMTRARHNLVLCNPATPNHVGVYRGTPCFEWNSTGGKCEVPF
jgi:superfamily I DNA/RNA helicase